MKLLIATVEGSRGEDVKTGTGQDPGLLRYPLSAFLWVEREGHELSMLPPSKSVQGQTQEIAMETTRSADGTRIAAGRRIEAVEAFLTEAVGVPPEYLPTIESGPDFPGMVAIAHTLAYDLAICADGRVPGLGPC
jgi:hypothetical protein